MAQMPVQLAEWRPDLALLDNQFSADAENVFVGLNSYLPIPSLLPFGGGTPLPGPCVGLCAARTSDGRWQIYAGTRTGLFKFASGGWIDVSRTAGGPYNVPIDDLWSFAQFGDHLVAVQIGDVPQELNIKTGTNFAALGGSPPIAHKVTQVGDFLVLSGLKEGQTLSDGTVTNQRQIIWCSVNNVTGWTIGTNLCDMQEFPDGGPVQGVAGGEIGYVVQDRAIRLMQFLPGDTNTIFSFTRVVQDRGSISEFGYTTVANVLYFLAEEGFYALSGAQLNPIGNEKVNEWFLKNADPGRRNLVQAITAQKPWVAWASHSSSSVQQYDLIIMYNWALDRWAHMTEFAQMWATLASAGLDLDTDDPSDPDDPDLDSNSQPLDSFVYEAGRPLVCAVDINGFLCTLNGPNLQATLESAELHLAPGQRAFVNEVYPLIDAPEVVISVGIRERLQDPVVWTPPQSLEVTGSATVQTSSRLHRFKMIAPRGSVWTRAQGFLADAQQDGTKA